MGILPQYGVLFYHTFLLLSMNNLHNPEACRLGFLMVMDRRSAVQTGFPGDGFLYRGGRFRDLFFWEGRLPKENLKRNFCLLLRLPVVNCSQIH